MFQIQQIPAHGEPAPTPHSPIWQRFTPYLYILPAVALILLWVYRPLIETFSLAFYDWNLMPTTPKRWTGTDNFEQVLRMGEMHKATVNTLIYIGGGLILLVALPVLIVLATRRINHRAGLVYQALIFTPFLVTPVATGAVWRWLFAEDSGALTQVASALGIDLGNVFRSPETSLWAILAIMGWQMLGFGVLMVSAGYTGINSEYSEAAALDGASEGRIVRRIVLPLLSPTLSFLGLMTILLVAQWTFPLIDLLTKGGPGESSTNLYYLLYEYGFQTFDSGISAAAGTLFFLAFAVVAFVFVELSERLIFYDN